MALTLAAAGIIGLARLNREANALTRLILLAAMLLAPLVAAFALFFCVFHTPLHLRETLGTLIEGRRGLLSISVALTALSLGLAAVLTMVEPRPLQASLVAATFMTLSILNVPHMLAPLIVRTLDKQRPSSIRG